MHTGLGLDPSLGPAQLEQGVNKLSFLHFQALDAAFAKRHHSSNLDPQLSEATWVSLSANRSVFPQERETPERSPRLRQRKSLSSISCLQNGFAVQQP